MSEGVNMINFINVPKTKVKKMRYELALPMKTHTHTHTNFKTMTQTNELGSKKKISTLCVCLKKK